MALLDQHWLHVVFRSIRLLHAASMTAFFQKIRSKLGICLHWLWFICMFHISMSLGVINMNSIHSCCRFHHWLGWASLPMCLVVSTWGSLQMHRRYILKIRRGKQLNKIKQVFFCVYTDLTLFHNINQHWLGSFTGSISDALLDGLIISMAATSCTQECLQSWYNNNCLFTLHSSHPGHVSVQDSVWSPPPHRCSGHQVQQLQKLQGTSKGRALQIMDWIGNEEKKAWPLGWIKPSWTARRMHCLSSIIWGHLTRMTLDSMPSKYIYIYIIYNYNNIIIIHPTPKRHLEPCDL